ncbi:MAG: diguanylate cyclase [Acidobacteria bacterium]|nr:diguanylate cyclase [Acidobacteriota bacterium]
MAFLLRSVDASRQWEAMDKKDKPQASFHSKIFQWTIIAIGGLLWLACLEQLLINFQTPTYIQFAFFLLGVVAISLYPVQITTPGMSLKRQQQLSISLSDALTFLLLILQGPVAAIVIGGIDGLIASRRTVKRWQSNFFTLAMYALSFQAATFSFDAMLRLEERQPNPGFHYPVLSLVAPLLVAATIHFVVNSTLLSIILGLRYNRSIRQHWIDNQLWTGVTYFPLTMLTLFLYICVKQVGWVMVLAAVPVFLITYYSISQYNKKVEEKMQKIEEMNELHLSIVQALALSIDAKDSTTADHVQRVKIYGRGMARLFGLSELEIQAIEAGAMLHDVGKLAVPDYILNKPSKLTEAEFEKMKIHTLVGAEILTQVKFPYPVVPVVRHHHERWDGSGYPDGLKGEAIPLTARILSVIDCFDAVREKRHYRKAMTRQQAIEMLQAGAGKNYDPTIVEIFLKHLPEFEAEIAARQLEQPDDAEAAELLAQVERASGNLTPVVAKQDYARTLEKISAAHRELVILYEIAQTVGSSLSLRDTLSILLERVEAIVPSTTSLVLLKVKEREQLRVASTRGVHGEEFYSHTIKSGSGIVGWVYANNKPMYNSDPRLDLDALKVQVSQHYKTSVVVPLGKDDGVVGALALYSSELGQYSLEHIRLVESIARLASDAVLNALNHEEMEATAFTDKLTGLPNLRAILEVFENEACRAQRHDEQFSLLMMDLDKFKQINDTLGHQVGDQFLKEVSRIISAQMRSCDFFGRYAGDEFIAILPRTTKEEALAMIDRIKSAVENFVLMTSSGSTTRAGISIGAAEFLIDGNTIEALMNVADQAMYSDKAKSKNSDTGKKQNDQVIPFPQARRTNAV